MKMGVINYYILIILCKGKNCIIIKFCNTNLAYIETEFPIVSSSSSTIEEPVWVSEEPKEYSAKQSEDFFLSSFR